MREKKRSMDSTPTRILATRLALPVLEVFADFRFEALFDALIRFELNSFDFPSKMTMVVTVRVVVTEDATAVDAAPVGIDQCE
jgi:hypothetical protein